MNPNGISIVIPCFNHGDLLQETLASVERVRNDNVAEVIIVNDGSTEPETCRLFETLPRAKYTVLHQSNKGLGAARNTGIRHAQTEFIVPLDSDNLLRDFYLTRGLALLRDNPKVGVLYGDAEYFGDKTGRWNFPDFNLGAMTAGNVVDACALFRKSVWSSVNGYDEHMPRMGYEDWDFWLRVALQGWEFMHVSEVAQDYRVRRNSMITETNRHVRELSEYIFNKPENRLLSVLRHQQLETKALAERLRNVENSLAYRLGRKLVDPVKRLLGRSTC